MNDLQQHTGWGMASQRTLLCIAWVLHLVILVFVMCHHEPWGDELHSWNLAKASGSFADLLHNSRYEGHPPVWYTLIWTISKCTHDFVWVQVLQVTLASGVAALLLFYAPFPLLTRLLLPFGYYFLYEYAILSRNYVPGVLAAFLICILLGKQYRYKPVLYYLLLLLMSNVHLMALILAGSLHLYFLMDQAAQKQKRSTLILHVLLGACILFPAVYFIKPPSDTDLSIGSSLSRWTTEMLAIDLQAPLRGFLPLPAWWTSDCWARQALLELHPQYPVLKVISPLLSLGFILLGLHLLKGSRKAQALFAANAAVTFLAGLVHSVGTQRHSGYLFVGFLVAYWLYASGKPLSSGKKKIFNSLLVLQLIGGIIMIVKDVTLPFSNFYKIKTMLAEVPPGEQVVTDYWTLIAGAAYMDRSFYCLDLQQEHAFIIWGRDMAVMTKKPYRYCDGLEQVFRTPGRTQVYFYTASSPEVLQQTDHKLFSQYHVQLIDKADKAIEKWSNLYLYRISKEP